jgi:hypothetical protein
MTVLKIYGEEHFGSSEDQQRKEEYIKKAERGEVIFLKEGANFSLGNQNNVYGIEDSLPVNMGNTMKTYMNASLAIKNFTEQVGLDSKHQIPEKIKFLHKNAKRKFTYIIAAYLDNIFSLLIRNEDGERAKIEEVGFGKKGDEFQAFYNKYFTLFKNMSLSINNELFPEEFFSSFLRMSDKLDLFIKKICFSWLGSVKIKYNKSGKYENLTNELLENFFTEDAPYKNKLFKEIALSIRNEVFAKNIFLLLENMREEKEIIFIVGNNHINGLRKIFNEDPRVNKLNLTIQYFDKNISFKFFKQPQFVSINSCCAPVCIPPMP